MFEPVKAKTEQTFVDSVSAINDISFALVNSKQTQAYHPDVGQTSSNQEPADTDGIGEMAFVDVKTATLLVREEGFDTETTFVEPASLTAVGQIGDQVDWFFVVGSPPGNQIEGQGSSLSESDLVDSDKATLLLGKGVHSTPGLSVTHLDTRGGPQRERPMSASLHPFHHLRGVILPISQQDLPWG